MRECKCKDWASMGNPIAAISDHHENCEHYPGDVAVLKALIHDLMKGVECWAADEDGVHDEAWEAYQKAKFLIDGVLLKGERR